MYSIYSIPAHSIHRVPILRHHLPSELVRKCAKLETCCFYPCFSDRLHKNNGKSERIIGEIEGIMGKNKIFEHNLSSPTGSTKV